MMQANKFLLIFIFYIDDLVIFFNILKMINSLKAKFKKEDEMNDLEELHYYFRVEFVRDHVNKKITMRQISTLKRI